MTFSYNHESAAKFLYAHRMYVSSIYLPSNSYNYTHMEITILVTSYIPWNLFTTRLLYSYKPENTMDASTRFSIQLQGCKHLVATLKTIDVILYKLFGFYSWEVVNIHI